MKRIIVFAFCLVGVAGFSQNPLLEKAKKNLSYFELVWATNLCEEIMKNDSKDTVAHAEFVPNNKAAARAGHQSLDKDSKSSTKASDPITADLEREKKGKNQDHS